MLEELVPGLFTWSDTDAWTGHPGRVYVRTGFALRLPERGVLALVDPPSLALDERTALEALGRPTHVLVTCGNHARAAADARARWGARVLVPPAEATATAEETPVDGPLTAGERLWGVVDVLPLPGFGYAEEVALLVRNPRSVLIIGDAVCGGRDDLDIPVPDGEVGVKSLAAWRKDLLDLAAALAALTGLLTHPCDVLAFGHGRPVLSDPHAALGRLLARRAWPGG